MSYCGRLVQNINRCLREAILAPNVRMFHANQRDQIKWRWIRKRIGRTVLNNVSGRMFGISLRIFIFFSAVSVSDINLLLTRVSFVQWNVSLNYNFGPKGLFSYNEMQKTNLCRTSSLSDICMSLNCMRFWWNLSNNKIADFGQKYLLCCR